MANGLDRVLLYGKPGTGKTYFGLNYHLGTSKSYRLICTDEMTDGDMIGKYKQNDNGIWRFEEGVAIKAWRTGGRLVVDEINRVNGDIEARLMAIIDTVASSSFEHPETGEIIRPAQGFSVVATMNGEPEDLSPAVLDRLVVRVEIEQPHPDAIAALPAELRDIALEYAMRDDADRYSLRSFFAFAGLLKTSGNLEASAHVCLPRIAKSIVGALAITQSEAVQNIPRPESAVQEVSRF
jgi:MoxR-like ATPase